MVKVVRIPYANNLEYKDYSFQFEVTSSTSYSTGTELPAYEVTKKIRHFGSVFYSSGVLSNSLCYC